MSPEEAAIREDVASGAVFFCTEIDVAALLGVIDAERARVERTSAILDENAPTRTAPRYSHRGEAVMNGRWAWVPWDELRAALDGTEQQADR
jgi:hypothetical protein